MAQDDFYAKSKEDLSAIAIAFNLVTAEKAGTMSQADLANLLSAEQKKSQKTESSSKNDSVAEKKAPAKRGRKPKEKVEAAPKEEAQATDSPKSAEEQAETAPKAIKAEKKPSGKRGRKPASEEKTEGAETSKQETSQEESPVTSEEAKPKTSEKKSSGRKKKNAETKTPIEEIAEQVSSEVKEEIPQEKQEAEETKAESSETNEKKQTSEKRSRNKKKAKKDNDSENKQPDEDPTEVKEQAAQQPEATPSENATSENSASEANPQDKNVQGKNHQNKKQKKHHRSIEIRPAGEAAASESGEVVTDTDEKSAENGEASQEQQKPQIEPIEFVGVLEIVSDGGYGFVRRENYLPSPQDVFVPTNLIRRFGLRMGDQIRGFALPKRGQDKNLALSYITTVNDVEVDKLGKRPHFERLTPIYPDERFRLETGKQELSTRIIDLVSPIGKGQRGMIVSPPKAGKTILLQKVANAITQNSPKTKLIVLLIDERPEEVTDMQRSIKGEVVYSTFDKKPENHTRVTELVLERAMRLVEMGEDVVILLDSMTRLARAYNLTITPTGRTLSGGLDPGSLYGPKRFFGAARNIENGGSLTIVATSLIETGSRMDEVIFEEFKGTGNMEVYLDRKLSEKRIFPAIDINKSGTRREDLLMTQEELDAVWTIRKAFSQMETAPVTETIINLLLRTNSNDHFIRSVKVSFADKEVFDAMRGSGSQGGNAKE